MNWSQPFQSAPDHLFFRSTKNGDPRWGERVQKWQGSLPKAGDFIVAGYPDDEGIALNQGRVGAALAPDAIRSRFYKTSISPEQLSPNFNLYDLGNLSVDVPLEERHSLATKAVQAVVSSDAKWIGLGGGHDYGYPDGAGFLKANQNSKHKPLILNFDAHLDVRPTDKGLSSGTPFYRLLTEKNLGEFDFYQIGIQKVCNSAEHINWVTSRGGEILFLDELLLSGQSVFKTLLSHCSELLTQPHPTFLSVDIDCFSSSFAMGASQSWPCGLTPMDLLPLFSVLQQRLNVQVLGLYEVSPPLDQDECTVKLATQILHNFLRPNP